MLPRRCLCALIAVMTLQAQSGGRGGPVRSYGSGSAPGNPPADCAVSGTVINAMTGEPVPRAMVSLGGFDAAGSATDATGHWSISNTSCTLNRPVNASHIGFIASNMLRTSPGSRPTVVNLVSGTPVTGVKISLMPEASIAGKVLDPNGDPIEGVRVQAAHAVVQAGQRTLVNTGAAATDSQGNFRIGGLPPGRYVICAASSQLTYPVGGGPAMVYREDCFPGPVASGISIAMPVEAGREIRTSLTLTPVEGVHFRGSVNGVPNNGVPENGARVQLVRKAPGNMAIVPNLMAPVQHDGTFDIPSVLPGSYTAVATWQPNPPGAQPVILQAPVEVGDSDVNNVSLTPQQSGSLSGTVHYQFSNPATAANPPVTVNLRPASNNNGFIGRIPQAQWDSDHLNFDFANVPAGAEIQLNVSVGGREVYIRSVTLRGQDILNKPFTVEGTTGPVDIMVSDDTGSIDATVNDSDDRPAIDASVILLSTTGLRRILASGDDGHATQQYLPTGEYRAWAFDSLSTVPYSEDEWMSQNAGPGEHVSVTSGSAAAVTLKRLTAPAE